ncbi:hypothetical protein [Furfurilactobacillus siliginis]|uniref:Uncharacterized protein n=1 Tax=Furfurilactobacillus siliginis TaxID=348151 RepID=A0A510VP15_9LACO|nr:hypothetical protein [Furfurilactobacillus siliginis]GEK28496.1 hypothetical protein LSI01_08070 [Furfurilactobacillus siliginis]
MSNRERKLSFALLTAGAVASLGLTFYWSATDHTVSALCGVVAFMFSAINLAILLEEKKQ